MISDSEGSNDGRGVSRLGGAVLRHLGEHAGAQLAPAALGTLAGVSGAEGERLAAWLERIGLLERTESSSGAVFSLADPWHQQRRRNRPLILLVEDHASVAGMTEAVLTSEGYNVVLVRNPVEAHALLRIVAFDVILTDSFSPTLELAVRVLGPLLRRAAGTPLILFTAHHWNPARVQAEGFTEIITKPFDVEEFLTRIVRLATMHRAAGK